ncbi:hypothetical protein H0H93_013018 [Arthromyces matolae]|nr:hypothetical protein H0H93_013018 [Arthromyces matolae]
MADKQQRLVYAIIDFLNQSISEGKVRADDVEGLEVAIQCIGEAFNVDPSNQQQVDQLSVKPATLQSIFDVFLKTRDKVSNTTATGAQPASSTAKTPTADEKAQADAHKQRGNSLMSVEKYDEAIQAYDQAVSLDPSNPIYYSNRAAAYSNKGDHLAAVGDADKAISLDSKFIKAYHRLGHAYFSLGDFEKSAEAYQTGLDQDPGNASLQQALRTARSRITSAEPAQTSASRETDADSAATGGGLGDLSSMFSGMGGAGGGLPDIASMMNNPQMMAMAQQMAANGGLANLMQNPAVSDMMSRVQRGDMPSMQELMNNPALRDLWHRILKNRGESTQGRMDMSTTALQGIFRRIRLVFEGKSRAMAGGTVDN